MPKVLTRRPHIPVRVIYEFPLSSMYAIVDGAQGGGWVGGRGVPSDTLEGWLEKRPRARNVSLPCAISTGYIAQRCSAQRGVSPWEALDYMVGCE